MLLFLGSEAVNASGEAVRGLVKSQVEFTCGSTACPLSNPANYLSCEAAFSKFSGEMYVHGALAAVASLYFFKPILLQILY